MTKPINPFSAIAQCLGLLYAAVPNTLHQDQRDQFEDGIRKVNEAAAELQTFLDNHNGGPTIYDTDRDPSAFDRDGVGGDGGSLPDGWSLAGDGSVVHEDGRHLENAHILRAGLEADPLLQDVTYMGFINREVFDAATVNDFLPEASQSLSGLVAVFGEGRDAIAKCVRPAIEAAPEEPAPEPEPVPAPEPEPESTTAEDAYDPAWPGYDEDPKKWTPEQTSAFEAWFDALPEGAKVEINHFGVRDAFHVRRGDTAAPQEGGQDAQVEGATTTGTTEAAEAAPGAAPEPEKAGKPKK